MKREHEKRCLLMVTQKGGGVGEAIGDLSLSRALDREKETGQRIPLNLCGAHPTPWPPPTIRQLCWGDDMNDRRLGPMRQPDGNLI